MLTHPACVSKDRELVIRVCVCVGVFPGLAILSVPYKHPRALVFSQEVILGVEGHLVGRQGSDGPTQLRFPEALFQAVLRPHSPRRPLTECLLISGPSPRVPVSAGGKLAPVRSVTHAHCDPVWVQWFSLPSTSGFSIQVTTSQFYHHSSQC